jgi:PRC-barrel domain
MRPIRHHLLGSLRVPFGGVGAIIAGALVLGVATAQTPPDSAAGQEAKALNGASLDYFPRDHLFHIMGREVVSAKGEDMGRIVDVLFDEKGEPHAAVIDFGGFLGVGSRKIAVSWKALRFDLGEKKNIIALDVGRDQLKAAPEYKSAESDKPIAVVAQPETKPPGEAAAQPETKPPGEAAPDPGR